MGEKAKTKLEQRGKGRPELRPARRRRRKRTVVGALLTLLVVGFGVGA